MASSQIHNYQRALTLIRKGQPDPVYFIFGDEVFLIDNLIQTISECFVGELDKEINYYLRYAPETTLEDVLALTAGAGLFSQRKVIVFRDYQQLRTPPVDKLLSYLKRSNPDICLIITATVDSINQAKYQSLKPHLTMVQVDALQAKELHQFIREEFASYNKPISGDAIETLIYMVGEKIHDLKTEIAQVANFFRDKEQIEPADVESIVGVHAVQTVFELTGQIARKRLNEALHTMHNLLEKGESPQMILALLIRHMLILWKIRGFYQSGEKNEQTIMRQLKLYPRHFKAYLAELSLWSMEQLQNALAALEESDRLLKSGQAQIGVIMDILLFKLNRR